MIGQQKKNSTSLKLPLNRKTCYHFLKSLDAYQNYLEISWKIQILRYGIFSRVPDNVCNEQSCWKTIGLTMIFYLVCFTFSIAYSVLPFHLVYVFQVLHLSFFCFWCSFSRLWCHCYPWGRVIIPKLSSFSLSIRSDQIRSVAQSCLTLCDPMNRSTPGLPAHHQLRVRYGIDKAICLSISLFSF